MAAALDFTRPHVLRNRREFNAAVREIDQLLDADPRKGTEQYERLEFLSVLVEAYERKHLPDEETTPQEVVDFMLEQRDMARSELSDVLGGRSRVSEFFSGRRELSKAQAVALRDLLGIPLDALLG